MATCEAAAWLTIFPTTLQDIKLFINSPGGSVTAGMGIYDAMQVRSLYARACVRMCLTSFWQALAAVA